jgi:hypothetical protein
MLRDVRAAVDRLAQRVDGVEAASKGAPPPAAALSLAARSSCPPPSAATARSRASTTDLVGGGSFDRSNGGGGHAGGGDAGKPRPAGEGDSPATGVGSQQGTETDGQLLSDFSSLPFAQASGGG